MEKENIFHKFIFNIFQMFKGFFKKLISNGFIIE